MVQNDVKDRLITVQRDLESHWGLCQRKKNEGFQLAATETLLKLAVRPWINPCRRPTATSDIVCLRANSSKKVFWVLNPLQQSKSIGKLNE